MQQFKNALSSILLCAILFSCKSVPTDSLGEESLKEIISNESGGKITVQTFSKTNGIKREVMGASIYSMEFTSQIRFEETCWKTWELISSMFTNFKVIDDNAKHDWTFNSSIKKKFYKDALIDIQGEISFEKTENGWRKTNYKITKANIISNPKSGFDKFRGKWRNGDWGLVILEQDGKYWVVEKYYGSEPLDYGLATYIVKYENEELKCDFPNANHTRGIKIKSQNENQITYQLEDNNGVGTPEIYNYVESND